MIFVGIPQGQVLPCASPVIYEFFSKPFNPRRNIQDLTPSVMTPSR
jgi:hypothetical protein